MPRALGPGFRAVATSTGASAHPGQARTHRGWRIRRPQVDRQRGSCATSPHRPGLRDALHYSATYGRGAHVWREGVEPAAGHPSCARDSWRTSREGAMSLKRFDAAPSLKAKRQWSSTQMLLLTNTAHAPSPRRWEMSLVPGGCRPLRRRPVSGASRCAEHSQRRAVPVSIPPFASSRPSHSPCPPLPALRPAAISPSAQFKPEFPLRLLVMYNAPEQNQESGKKREDGPAPC